MTYWLVPHDLLSIFLILSRPHSRVSTSPLNWALPHQSPVKKMLYRLDYRYFDENIFPIEVSLPEKCIFYSFDTELAKMVGLNLAKVM